jgi:hypothetical protein
MAFTRNLSSELIENLKKESLFNDHLLPDLKAGKIFCALRNGSVDFYHKGSKLFGYGDNGFSSHYKFCLISKNQDKGKEYITENKLQEFEVIKNFAEGYDRIKKNASMYAGLESGGVSYLHGASYLQSDGIMLLDIEAAMYDADTKDRIDIVLYDNQSGELKFVEAKHYSNKELWAQEGNKPEVVAHQIPAYEMKIAASNVDIVEAYSNYIDHLNALFGLNLNKPQKISSTVGLYMYGFDASQKERIERLLKQDGSLENIKHYFLGDPKKIDLKTLWNNV